jgi:hypothetical protein
MASAKGPDFCGPGSRKCEARSLNIARAIALAARASVHDFYSSLAGISSV